MISMGNLSESCDAEYGEDDDDATKESHDELIISIFSDAI